jgi:hypothetical protein
MEAWSGSVQFVRTHRDMVLTLFSEALSISEGLFLQSRHDVD